MARRLAPYETRTRGNVLMVMPANQKRETVEDLLSPDDRDKGRQAVDALIESAFTAQDDAGRLRRIV